MDWGLKLVLINVVRLLLLLPLLLLLLVLTLYKIVLLPIFCPLSLSPPQIKNLLVSVGDFHHFHTTKASLEENLEGLAEALTSPQNRMLALHTDFIVSTIVKCAAQLSTQTPIYGTLVGLLNVKEKEFGQKVIRAASLSLQDMLGLGRYVNAKLLLRFFGELANARVLKVWLVLWLEMWPGGGVVQCLDGLCIC